MVVQMIWKNVQFFEAAKNPKIPMALWMRTKVDKLDLKWKLEKLYLHCLLVVTG